MTRALSLAAACVLMACAAYGLSPDFVNDDYCLADGTERPLWPPGWRCVYLPSPERGTSPVAPPTANPAAFFVILGVGVAFVLLRRSSLALASALVFGLAGIGAALLTPVHSIFFAWVVGGVAAYAVTRSFAAVAPPLAAFFVAYVVQFWDDVPLAWAAALLVLMVLPQRPDVDVRPR